MNKPIQGVLFDLDGTLIDTYNIILASFRYTMKTLLGKDFPDEVLMQKVGQPLTVQMWDFTSSQEVHDEMLRVYREHNEATHDSLVRSFAGVAECLQGIQALGLSCGVVTSKRHELAQRGLDCTGLSPYIQLLIGSDDCDVFKPEPGPVLKACECFDLNPQRCVYVGDSPFDMQAGNAAHCISIAVLWGMFSQEALSAQNPNYLCTSPNELLLLLRDLVK